MASTGWSADRSLSDRLQTHFADFNLLQMVRLWLKRPGGQAFSVAKTVRFAADLDAGFPGQAATQVAVHDEVAERLATPYFDRADAPLRGAKRTLQITTPDYCVGSALGPLPEPFLDWMRNLDRNGQPAMRRFLDLFNNRINQLRYETRAQFDPGLNNHAPERSQLASYLGALMGIHGAAQTTQIPMSPRQWLGMGDLLANSRRSAVGLVQVLAATLACPVRLEPLIGARRRIDPADQHRLGQRRLGEDSLLGRSMWDPLARVRLVLGPLDYAQMLGLLPALPEGRTPRNTPHQALASGAHRLEHSMFHTLQSLVRLLLDRRHDVELHIHVRQSSLPLAVLEAPHRGEPGAAPYGGLRLGQTAWLVSRPADSATPECSVTKLLIPAFASAPMQ